MEKIQLNQDMMNILLAAKRGTVEVNKCIFQLVYGKDDVDYDTKNDTLIYWLNETLKTIISQEHKQRVGASYSIVEYLDYIERYKRVYDANITVSEGVALFLASRLKGLRFRHEGEDIFEVVEEKHGRD